ncbi:MAG: 4Fe-4S ferredoxin, partial [Thermoplasmata archaeon]
MDIKMPEDNKSPECIRCGKCVSVCPVSAIKLGFT